MRFVAVKTVEQQDIQAMHRVREGLMIYRNAKANQIRGLVAEYGLVAPKTNGAVTKSNPVLARGCRERSAIGLSHRYCTVFGKICRRVELGSKSSTKRSVRSPRPMPMPSA